MNSRYYTVELCARLLKKYSARRRRHLFVGTIGDHISLRILLDGIYEKNQLDFIRSVCQKNSLGRSFLDIGANIGNHTIALADNFDSVIAIEASELTSRILHLNIRLNRIENVVVHNVAAGEHSSTAYMGLSQEDNLGSNKLTKDVNDTIASEVVDVVSLDTLLPDLNDLDLVKIDVEGFEVNALRGMKVLLMKNSPVIAFESNSLDECRAIMDTLISFGYDHFYYMHKGFEQYPNFLKYLLRLFRTWKWERLAKESSQVSDLIVASKIKLTF